MRMKKSSVLVTCALLVVVQTSFAGSATWNLNPGSGNWSTAINWTPNTVPDGSTDIATFGISNTTGVSLSASAEVDSVVFNPGASPFTITVAANDLSGWTLTVGGAGIINNSRVTQNFVTTGNPPVLGVGHITFTGSATAGSSTVFTNKGGNRNIDPVTAFTENSSAGNATFINEAGRDPNHEQPGVTEFLDNATAANGIFISNGATRGASFGGTIAFFGNSTAGNGIFACEGGASNGSGSAFIQFTDTASAGNGNFTLNGTDFDRASGASINFIFGSPTAANATLIARGGAVSGGRILLSGATDGGTARVEVFSNGNLDISDHSSPGVTIGSLEGDGLVFLGTNNLTIGSNSLTTTFSGVIQDSGSLTKIGGANLTLSNANSYTGGTIVNDGILLANNTSGSATGTGPVRVMAGTLGGSGTIGGAVVVGTGSGPGAILGPGNGTIPGTLTIQNKLTLKGDVTYKVLINSSTPASDQVTAKGIRIRGALILFDDRGTAVLLPGTTFTVISNTAATPIAGTFNNLADGSTVTVGNNTFHVNYDGGTGNDLTLTVVP